MHLFFILTVPDPFFHVHLYIEQCSEFIHPFIDMGCRPQVKIYCFQYIGQMFGQLWYQFGEGACHGDELFTMFVPTKMPFVTLGTKKDVETSKLMVRMWTNFAKYFDPTPNKKEFGDRWPRLVSERRSYLFCLLSFPCH